MNFKPITGIATGDLCNQQPKEIIRICAGALQDIAGVLEQHIIENEMALYNDKAAAKLMKNYIDDAVYWHKAS